MRNIFLIVTVFAVALASMSSLAEVDKTEIGDTGFEAQRQLFVQAEASYQSKQYTRYRKLKAQLTNYPLYPYLVYKELHGKVSLDNEDTIRVFLYEYENSPLASRLRSEWLHYLAIHHQWKKYIEYYQDDNDRNRECLYRTALLKTGSKDYALSNLDDVWLTSNTAPTSCNYVFHEWYMSGKMSSAIVFERIELAVYRKHLRLARSLAPYLPANERHWIYEIEKAYYHPLNVLQNEVKADYNKYEFMVLKHALIQLTRDDPSQAAQYFINLKKNSNFCSYDCDRLEHNITYHLLNSRIPNALEILQKMDLHNVDSIHRTIFLAMYDDDWKTALKYIDKLDKDEQLTEQWLYWRARTLHQLGNHRVADAIYRHLAGLRNYYGFMAADHIGAPYNLESHSIVLSDADFRLILTVPGIQRARELVELGRIVDARREWTYAVNDLSDDQLYIAAQLANKWLWHDRAIYTISNTSYTDDLDLRFPMPFKSLITTQSDENNLDPAWVYALIRQESLFMHDARSGTGALGLMQLMPATAQQSAHRLKKRVHGRYEILQPHNNITLGTYYLKRIYNRFYDNMVLATAAYNAGPTNVRRWMPDKELDWDIWIETIPYDETRNYVENIASFRAIYSNRLGGRQFRLVRDLDPIPPRAPRN